MADNVLKFLLKRMASELWVRDEELTDRELFQALFTRLRGLRINKDTEVSRTSKFGTMDPGPLLVQLGNDIERASGADGVACAAAVIKSVSAAKYRHPEDMPLAWLVLTRRYRSAEGVDEVGMRLRLMRGVAQGRQDVLASRPDLAQMGRDEQKLWFADGFSAMAGALAGREGVRTVSDASVRLWNLWLHEHAWAGERDLATRSRKVREVRSCVQLLHGWCQYSPGKRELVEWVRDGVRDELGVVSQLIDERFEWPVRSSGAEHLEFVFGDRFRREFDVRLQERDAFPWSEGSLEHDQFWEEMDLLARLAETSTSAEAYRQAIEDAYAMCLVAALVGPGSFLLEMGRALPREGGATTRERRDFGPDGPLWGEGTAVRLVPVRVRGTDASDFQVLDARDYPASRFDLAALGAGEVVIRVGRDGTWATGEASLRLRREWESRRHAEIRLGSHNGETGWWLHNLSRQGSVVRTAGGCQVCCAPEREADELRRAQAEGRRPLLSSWARLEPGDIVTFGEPDPGQVVWAADSRGWDGYRFELG